MDEHMPNNAPIPATATYRTLKKRCDDALCALCYARVTSSRRHTAIEKVLQCERLRLPQCRCHAWAKRQPTKVQLVLESVH